MADHEPVVAIVPGDIAPHVERDDGSGLDTDRERAPRLLGLL